MWDQAVRGSRRAAPGLHKAAPALRWIPCDWELPEAHGDTSQGLRDCPQKQLRADIQAGSGPVIHRLRRRWGVYSPGFYANSPNREEPDKSYLIHPGLPD